MKKIVVGSTNPVKVEAAKLAFTAMFPDEQFDVQGIDAPSNITEQPWGDEETLAGARNRIAATKALVPDAQFWVANESGVKDVGTDLFITNWVIIANADYMSTTHSASFVIPPDIAAMLRTGVELGPALEQKFGAEAAKRGAGGAGKLTHGVITRCDLLRQAMVTALIPFTNPDLYFSTESASTTSSSFGERAVPQTFALGR